MIKMMLKKKWPKFFYVDQIVKKKCWRWMLASVLQNLRGIHIHRNNWKRIMDRR
jgi:hypothetical protein